MSRVVCAAIGVLFLLPVSAGAHNATRKPPMKSFVSLPAADIDALVTYLQALK
jgi:hypothetical protein